MSESVRCVNRRRLLSWWFAALAFIAGGLSFSLAEDSLPQAELESAGAFHRVYVPADAPEKWPVGSQRYLPIPASEFLRLVEQAQGWGDRSEESARLTSAAYVAELLPDAVLDGTAELVVQLTSPHPRLLQLAPLNVAVHSASWNRTGAPTAELGLWDRGEGRQELAVLVTEPDTLHLDWELRARRFNSTSMEFIFEAPVTAPQTFALVLPRRHTAEFSSGVLIDAEELPNEKQRWLFQLAPANSHTLKVSRQAEGSRPETRSRVSRTTAYRLDASGLTFLTSLRFESNQAGASELRFAVSGGAKVLSVTIGNQPVPWQTEERNEATQLVVKRPPWQAPQVVEIQGYAQMQFDQPWQLPSLRALDVSWTEGTASLVVSPAIELSSLAPRQSNLQHIEGIQAQVPAEEVYRLQEWSPEASFEIVARRRRCEVKVHAATTIDLDPGDSQQNDSQSNETTAQTVAVLECQGRATYQVEAELCPGWSIESVKSEPPAALREWHVRSDSSESGRKLIRVQLDVPLGPEKPLKLEFDSRATNQGGLLPATVDQLTPLRFFNAHSSGQMLLLRSQKRGQMELLHGLEGARLAANELGLSDKALLPDIQGGVLIDCAHLNAGAIVEMRTRAAQYRADANVEVSMLDDSFIHNYQLNCNPISGVVSEIVLRLNRPIPEFTQWELVGHRGGIVVRQLDQDAESHRNHDQGVAYLLRLPVAIDQPFQLRAKYSTAAQDSQQCNLPYLPEASDWRGQVVIRGRLDGLSIDDRDWTPLAKPVDSANESLPIVGCYRLEAEKMRRRSHTSALTVKRNSPLAAAPEVVAWLADVRTLQGADGTAIYVASYLLENSGATGVEIELPLQVELQQAWLNEKQLEPREVLADENTCRFYFSDTQRYPTVTVQYVVHGPVLGQSATISPPLPKCSFPVNLGCWTLSLPEQYTASGTTLGERTGELTWSQRLFGPFARTPQEAAFNPFKADSWARLFAAHDKQRPKQFWKDSPSARGRRSYADELVHANSSMTRTDTDDSPWRIPLTTRLTEFGRNAVVVGFIETPPTVVIDQVLVQRARWYAIWMLAMVLGSWQLARWPDRLFLAAVILATACLIVPLTWVAEFQAALLGILSAGVLKIGLKLGSQEIPHQLATSPSTQFAVVAVCLGCFLVSGLAYAEPAADVHDQTPVAPHMNLYRVLFPVDSQGNASGNDVYLSESFLRELRETQSNLSQDGAQCVLTAALYRGGLPTGRPSGDPEDAVWSLIFEIESFVPNCQLYLPLQRDEANWRTKLHRLDGLPVALRWNQDGRGCILSLNDVGKHRLELIVEPSVVLSSQQARLQLHIPPVASASLDLDAPPHINDLHITSAGRIQLDEASGRTRTVLSTTDVLELQWTPAQDTSKTESISEVEQLAWLHVEPSVARLEVQFTLHALEAIPQLATLEVSPQLKLMPLEEDSPVESFEESPERPQRIELKFKEGLGSQVRVPLRFQLQRTSSLGRIIYPWVRLQGVKATRSLFAVSVSSGLSYDENLSEQVRSIPATEFSSAWETTEEPPLFAYSGTDGAIGGSLRVWPDPPTMTVQQTLRVHCELEHAHVEYEAAIDGVLGGKLTHRLIVPAEFEVEDVSVSRRGESEMIDVRWSKANNSQVVVFLSQPLQQAHLVTLSGTVNMSPQGELPLPAISMVGAGRNDIHLEIFRDSDTQVTWINPENEPEPVPLQGRPLDPKNLLVGRYVWRPAESTELGSLLVENNDPVFRAETLITIAKGADGWDATLHGRVSVLRGTLSHLRLEAPSAFQEPYRVLPESMGVVDEIIETAAGREITLLLTQPVSQGRTTELYVTGGLRLPADQRLVLPNLRLLDAVPSDRYVLLPTHLGEQSISWNLTGLTSKPLPRSLRHLVDSVEGFRPFFVDQEKFLAQEHAYHGPLDRAALRYVLVTGHLDQTGQLTATAELVLQPGRAKHCTVRLPPRSELSQLVTGHNRVRREPVNDRDWRVSLGPPFLPRKIKVVYRAKVDMADGCVRLTPPQVLIGDQLLPLPQTSWKIHCVGPLRLGSAFIGSSLLPEQFSRYVHQLPLEALADSRLLALELPLQEGQAWFYPWQQDTQQGWDLWRVIEPSANLIDEPDPAVLGAHIPKGEQADDWQALVSKLGTSANATENRLASSIYPPVLPTQLASLPTNAEACVASDEQGRVEIGILSVTSSDVWRWFFSAALLSSGLALLFYLRSKPGWHEIVVSQPHLLVAAVGLVWWLELSPSVLGLLLVASALLLLIYQKWIRLSQRQAQVTNTQLATGAN